MIIGIDGNEANLKIRVGVNEFAYQTIRELYELRSELAENDRVIVYLKSKPLDDLPKSDNKWQYRVLPGRGAWLLTRLTCHLLFTKEKPDVLFTPSHYLPPVPGLAKVCSIMDLGYLRFSDQFEKRDFWQLKYWSAISIYISKYILAISKTTKDDIVRHYKIDPEKVKTIYPGVSVKPPTSKVTQKDVRRTMDKYSIVGDFVLFLGTLKPSKNLEGLLEALSLLSKKGYRLKLVVVGKKGWLFKNLFTKVKELGLENKVVFTGYINEREKAVFLSQAKVLCSPSHWEGFGLHVLEAMAAGTAVVVGNAGSLPEIVGKAGLVVDPGDPREIARGIEKVLKMSVKEYNLLVAAGQKQAGKFSWEKTGRETLNLLIKAAKGKMHGANYD